MKVAVVGASGRLGSRVVEALLERDYEVRCLTRRWPVENKGDVEYVRGDVANVEALTELLEGCSCVIAPFGASRRTKLSDLWKNPELDPEHSKNVNYEGVKNLMTACEKTGCKRLIRVTGQNENPWSFFTILINALGSMAKAWNAEAENALRDNEKIDYTIIRPGVMSKDSIKNYALNDNGNKLKVSRISYDAVADLMVSSIEKNNTRRATLVAMTSPNGPSSWQSLLDKVTPDSRQFPLSPFKKHLFAVRVVSLVTFITLTLALRGLLLFLTGFFKTLLTAEKSLLLNPLTDLPDPLL